MLDGAHTRESAGALVQTVKSVFSPSQPVALVVAIMQGKDFSAVLRELAQLRPVAAIFTKVSAFGGQRSMPPGVLFVLFMYLLDIQYVNHRLHGHYAALWIGILFSASAGFLSTLNLAEHIQSDPDKIHCSQDKIF